VIVVLQRRPFLLLVVGFSTPCDCRTPTTSFSSSGCRIIDASFLRLSDSRRPLIVGIHRRPSSWLAHYVLVSHSQCWCLLYFLDCSSYLEFNFFPDCQICNRSSASLGETKESPPAESDGSIVLPASSCLDHLEGGHRHSQRYRPLPAPEELPALSSTDSSGSDHVLGFVNSEWACELEGSSPTPLSRSEATTDQIF
jgi:hypothetical protein